jgi:GTP-binding protein
VILVADPSRRDLASMRISAHHRAGKGGHGQGANKHGARGGDRIVLVPPGTTVEGLEGEYFDLVEPGQRAIVASGGLGGHGNKRFASATRQAPRFAESGLNGDSGWIELQLRLLADAGLVGLPNAGKSSLLARITRAAPKVADYPFTTLEPILGVVQVGGIAGQTFVMADVPGLIEGAAEGAGLGHEFLRHIKRTKVLIHVLDASGGLEGRDPLDDFKTINQELEDYDPELLERPMLVALNKVDLPESREHLPRLKRSMTRRKLPTFPISAATGEGVPALMNAVAAALREIELTAREAQKQAERKTYTLEDADERAWSVERLSRHHFQISGIGIERFTKMTNFDLDEGGERFQKVLASSGISAELVRQGIQPRDVVHVAGKELVWGETEALGVDPEKKRRTAAERKLARKR